MYTYSPSDSIADFTQAANTIRAMPGVSVPSAITPSQVTVPAQQMAPPVDPIQRGISALYMKGAELTSGGQQPMTFADGGATDKYYSTALGLTGTPFYRRVLGETKAPLMTPRPQASVMPEYTPIPPEYTPIPLEYTPIPPEYTPIPADVSVAPAMTIAETVPSFIEEIISDGDGFTTTPGEISGVGPTTVASDPAVFEALVNTPAFTSLTGLSISPAVSKSLSTVSGLANMAGLPGVSGLMGLATKSPIGILGTVVGALSPPLGLALSAFGGLAGLAGNMFGTDFTNPETGQTQVSGSGNQFVDAYNNLRGSLGAISAAMGKEALSMGPGVTVKGMMEEASGFSSSGATTTDTTVGGMGDFEGEGYDGSGGGLDGGNTSSNSTSGYGDTWADGGIVDFYSNGGGISALAFGGEAAPVGYANKAFEGMVPGQGSGMSDSVPFSIEGQQPALLSRDEYVLPADVVSQLGDGSSGAGADMLDSFVSQVRHQKYGHTKQPPENGGGLMGVLSAATGGSLMPMMERI